MFSRKKEKLAPKNTMKNPEGSKSNKKLTTNSDMKMADENSLALKVISLEKSMGTVECLDSILVENSDALKRIDTEIQRFNQSKLKNSEDDLVKDVKIKKIENKSLKKCRYFNRGHCKNKSECQFSHPSESCAIYLQEGICQEKPCQSRHPKVCKWTKTETGCRRQDCDFLHVTLAGDDGEQREAHKLYPCMGCKNVYDDKVCVVQHIAKNRAFFLCLNCDDWILRKDEILLPGWCLFDENGALKQNV